MAGPLEGIRVIEVNRVVPGTYCTMMLADMGADVIRVDMPADRQSEDGPGSMDPKVARTVASHFVDRNKKSVTLNLKEVGAQEALKRLSDTADVLVEGFRPGVMERLGADYDTLSRRNPKLVYCSLSGFGQDGPYRDFPAHDINYISLAGILGLLGKKGEAPTIPLNIIGDYAGATMHGVVGVLLALLSRERSGEGQHVDVSYLDSSIALLSAAPNMWDYFENNHIASGDGMFSGDYAYYTSYQTKDEKWLSIGCTEPWLWHNFCDAVGRSDLKSAAFKRNHFHDPGEEIQSAAQEEVTKIMMTKTRDEWFELLTKADVCVGKINNVDEVFRDPQVVHREMILETEHPVAGTIRQPGIPIKLSKTPGVVHAFPPYAGEHTEEILTSLGYGKDEIQNLRKEGIV